MLQSSPTASAVIEGPVPGNPIREAWSRDDLTWLACLCATQLGELAWFLSANRGWERLYLINAGQVLSALWCWLLMRRVAARPGAAAFWRLNAHAALLWLIGNVVYMTIQIVFDAETFPGPQDLFASGCYLLTFMAVLSLDKPAVGRSGRINLSLEAVGLITATLIVGWSFKLQETWAEMTAHPGAATIYPLLYPLFDVILLWLLSTRARHQRAEVVAGSTFAWLVLGIFALIAADFAFPNMLVDPSLQGGGTLADLGWGAFSFLWGLAALWQLRERRRLARPAGGALRAGLDAYPVSHSIVVMLTLHSWLLVMILLLLREVFSPSGRLHPLLLSVGVLGVLLLVITRQLREMRSNDHLNRLLREIETSREQFRRLFMMFPDAALLSDADSRVILEVNEGFTRLLGYGYDECIGLTGTQLGLWADPGDREHYLRELGEAGAVARYEGTARRRDGERVAVELTARMVEFGGRRYVINLLRDLTERRQAEERLRQSEAELHRAQKLEAIGTLAGGVAHDFNNLLTAIMGGTELALLDLPGEHPSRESLDRVLLAGRQARDLVRQILTFSRNQSSALRPTEIAPIIDDALRLLRPDLPAGLRLVHHRRPTPPVLGDPVQLGQVIHNLCTNAVHAMKGRADGVLEIIEETVFADESFASGHPGMTLGECAHVSVRDTGCGMSRQVLDRLFEPFFTTKPLGEGTGLGLAVVHGIVRQHRGTLLVHSVENEGSIFHLYLPTASQPQAAPEPRRPLASGQGGEIVCIDDDPAATAALAGQLRRLGFAPRCFHDADPAAAYLLEPAASGTLAVICDNSLPGIDGVSLARRVSRQRNGLVWILSSGFLPQETIERARVSGFSHFIDKPVSLADLSATLARAGLPHDGTSPAPSSHRTNQAL